MDSVRTYYDRFPEEHRLASGVAQIEAARTKQVLGRFLPDPPAVVVDVGGGAGGYAFWLANRGYDVHLVDSSPRLVALAAERNDRAGGPLASVAEGDARSLDFPDHYVDVVLLFGPLYHLMESIERAQAIAEATRVLKHGGALFAACITRWASLFDGLVNGRLPDAAFARMALEDVRTGEHRNPSEHPEWFTTAYFHRPADFEAELRAAGLARVEVFALEGPAALLPDFETRWADPDQRRALLDAAALVEKEAALAGLSPHLLAACRT